MGALPHWLVSVLLLYTTGGNTKNPTEVVVHNHKIIRWVGRECGIPSLEPSSPSDLLGFADRLRLTKQKRTEGKEELSVDGDRLISQILGSIPTQSQQERDETTPLLSEIMANARRGDPVAFTSLFQLHHSRIFTYLVHIVGRKEEAEDLAQETFLKAWQSLHQLKDDTRFSAWLYTIATHAALDYLRRQKLRRGIWAQPQDDAFSGQEEGRMSSFEVQIAETEHIRMALGQVARHYRICLLLYFVADCTQREIATLLKMSEKNVNVYIRRGCDQFRKAYTALAKGPISKPGRRTAGRRTIL